MPSSSPNFLRLILTGSVVLCAGWWFRGHRLVPLEQREAESLHALAGARQRLGTAKETIQGMNAQKQEAARTLGSLDALNRDIPKDPTLVWLPVRVKAHLQKGGVDEATIRINSAMPDPVVAGYERTNWHVHLPSQDGMRNMAGVLLALAEIERQEPFVRILDVDFHAGSEAPHWPTGGFNVTALVPK